MLLGGNTHVVPNQFLLIWYGGSWNDNAGLVEVPSMGGHNKQFKRLSAFESVYQM